MRTKKVAFVTNFCTHYTAGLYERFATKCDVDYFFYSAGKEWYWEHKLGVSSGEFRCEVVNGFDLGNTRIVPSLAHKLLRINYDVYIKCINGKFALPLTYLIARLRRKPFILRTGIWFRIYARGQRLAFPLTRYLYRHSDAIVVYGNHVKRYLISEGVRSERIFVAPHAVDNSFYGRPVTRQEKDELETKLGIPPQKKIVLYLGRLTAVKGCRYLLEAFASLKRDDTILVLAGDGQERSDLENLAKQLNVSAAVRFAGYVPRQEAPCYYSLAYVYVLPSVTTSREKETWGLVVNEAYNQGAPVITTDAVGAAAGGLVQHGFNGLIVPERDSRSLAQALATLLDDPALRDQMSRHAASEVANWTQERMADAFADAVRYALGIGPSAESFSAQQPAVSQTQSPECCRDGTCD